MLKICEREVPSNEDEKTCCGNWGRGLFECPLNVALKSVGCDVAGTANLTDKSFRVDGGKHSLSVLVDHGACSHVRMVCFRAHLGRKEKETAYHLEAAFAVKNAEGS